MSIRLDGEARFALAGFRRHARTLGTISRSFEILAREATLAYFAALTAPSSVAWIIFLEQTHVLVRRAWDVAHIIGLNARERAAVDFFTAIVADNVDLLDMPTLPRAVQTTSRHSAPASAPSLSAP